MSRILFKTVAAAEQYIREVLERGCGARIVPYPNGDIEIQTWDRP